MEDKIYRFKKLDIQSQEYISFSSEKTVIPTKIENTSIATYFNQVIELTGFNFKDIEIPIQTVTNIESLFSYISISDITFFIKLAAIVQHHYISYKSSEDVSKVELLGDFMEEHKNLNDLFEVIERYLFEETNEIHSIIFKYNVGDTVKIKNLFVQNDILRSIADQLDFTTENFYQRKEEIKSKTSNFNYEKGGEYVKMILTQNLYEFLENRTVISSKKKLEFCGVFLHICQAPHKKNEKDIEFNKEHLKETLELISYQHMQHYLNGRLKFSLY